MLSREELAEMKGMCKGFEPETDTTLGRYLAILFDAAERALELEGKYAAAVEIAQVRGAAAFDAEKERDALKAECDRLRKCVEFFAEPFTWARVSADAAHVFHDPGNGLLNSMYGGKAREALGSEAASTKCSKPSTGDE